LQIDATDNSRIVGTVSGPTWSAVVNLLGCTWDAHTNPAPFVGKYTLLFPGAGLESGPTQPQGEGFATLDVSAAGVVALLGTLGDNTPLTQTATLSGKGQWPLYASLYGHAGQIMGWLNFSNTPPTLAGGYDWIKLTNSATKYYPSGFLIQTNVLGSRYQAPTAAHPLLDFTNGLLRLAGGDYVGLLSNSVTNPPGNPLVYRGTNELSLKLNSPTFGLFSGSLRDPISKKTIAFKGGILQTQPWAAGLFVGTNQTGQVILGP
jgi:hypothetical protein